MSIRNLQFCECVASVIFALAPAALLAQDQPLGIFEGHQDVGTVLHAGSAQFDNSHGSYTIAGSGENMWFGVDDFHFVWKKVSGDVALTADIAFLGNGGNPHRKAVLMIRQTLDGNSASVDMAVHGSGLTSLQYRNPAGSDTHEVESNISGPKTVRIEKRGDTIYAFVSGKDGKVLPAGAATKLAFTDSFYIGIGVCAHDKDKTEKAIFSNVKLEELAPAKGKQILVSAVETISIASTDRHVEYVAAGRLEAPNWSCDGSYIEFKENGTLHRLTPGVSTGPTIAVAPLHPCEPGPGISPDGQWQVFLANDKGVTPETTIKDVELRLMSLKEKKARLLAKVLGAQDTANLPSWSPDSQRLVFVSYELLPEESMSAK